MSVREWDAATYDRVSQPQLAWGLAVLERVPLKGNEQVLDAGCGTGRVTAELAAHLPSGAVIAVDASCRDGGPLIAQSGGHGNLAAFRAVADRVASAAPYAEHLGVVDPHWRFATPDETADLLEVRCWLSDGTVVPPYPTGVHSRGRPGRAISRAPSRLPPRTVSARPRCRARPSRDAGLRRA